MVMHVQDVTVARAGLPVLEAVSFSLRAGQALVVRGANGSGKTTLLRTLAGLQIPLAGRIEVEPETLAYAAHADGVKAVLTVRENLAFWAAAYGQKSISTALSEMNLEALADRRAAQLSAGQKRRLGLARLLVTGRKIWIMDEPTVSLDAQSVAMFAEVVRRHLAAGGAALIATHIDLGLTADILDIERFRAKAPALGGLGGAFDEALE